MIGHPKSRYRELRSFTNQVRTISLANHLERMKPDEIRSRQLRHLRWMLRYAYDRVPFYRESFDRAGVKPDCVKSLEDISRFPVLTKSQILANYPYGIVARGYSIPDAFQCTSSGTTGVRGVYLSDWATRDANYAMLYRVRALFGFRPKDLECVFTYRPGQRRWYQKLGYRRRIRISMKDSPEDNISQLLDLRPESVYGYPAYLNLLRTSDAEGRLARLRPLLVLTSGEPLDPQTREGLGDAFASPIVDFYGAAEQPYISSQCSRLDGQHINMLNMVLEAAHGQEQVGPGETGDLLITTLTNRAMPLIRYRIGDTGRIDPSECECGRGGEILAEVAGRKEDFLKARDGSLVPPALAKAAVQHPRVEGFRIVQKAVGTFIVTLMGKEIDDRATLAIREDLRQVMGDPELEITFEIADRIDPDPSGKTRVVVSEA